VSEEYITPHVFDHQLAEKLLKLISDTQEIELERLRLDGSFEESGLTSLNALSIVFEIENEFGVTIRDEDALKLTNIRQVVELVQSLLAHRNQQAQTATQG
jgi:acyl carrier protein